MAVDISIKRRDDSDMATFGTVRAVCWQWRAIADRFAPLVLTELTGAEAAAAGAPFFRFPTMTSSSLVECSSTLHSFSWASNS